MGEQAEGIGFGVVGEQGLGRFGECFGGYQGFEGAEGVLVDGGGAGWMGGVGRGGQGD